MSYSELDTLIGHRVIRATNDTLTLDNGTRLLFQTDNDSCCSWVKLTALHTTDHIITAAGYGDEYENDDDDETGPYKAWIQVITDAGPLKIAEADGDASNGYYLAGFALSVTVLPAEMAN